MDAYDGLMLTSLVATVSGAACTASLYGNNELDTDEQVTSFANRGSVAMGLLAIGGLAVSAATLLRAFGGDNDGQGSPSHAITGTVLIAGGIYINHQVDEMETQSRTMIARHLASAPAIERMTVMGKLTAGAVVVTGTAMLVAGLFGDSGE